MSILITGKAEQLIGHRANKLLDPTTFCGNTTEQLVKKSSNTWGCVMSSENRLPLLMARQQKPLSSMMCPHRPAGMIRLRFYFFGVTRPPSARQVL